MQEGENIQLPIVVDMLMATIVKIVKFFKNKKRSTKYNNFKENYITSANFLIRTGTTAHVQ